MKAHLISLCIAVCLIATAHSSDVIDWEEIIDAVNNNNEATWTAGYNFPSNVSRSYLKRLQGTRLEPIDDLNIERPSFLDEISTNDIPAKFDAREHWSQCKQTISHIRDQGNCGSCWAVATASVFSDELCIAGKFQNNEEISSGDVLGCTLLGGCYGGVLLFGWLHIKFTGSVTGGDYNSGEGCFPYSLAECEHHGKGSRPACRGLPARTPGCPRKCPNTQYPVSFKSDKHHAKSFFAVQGEENIQKAILATGPVVAGFVVYEDFGAYKSGVYHHVTGPKLGGHAVKILGWGTENNKPYWLVANSWNADWGNKGYFKILRGNNECGFESSVWGGRV